MQESNSKGTSKQPQSNKTYEEILKQGCFAAIIVTTDIEFESIYEMFRWKELFKSQSGYMYYVAEIYKNNEKKFIAMTRQSEMGMMAASMTAAVFILEFAPKYLIMTGVLAGIQSGATEELVFGDIVAGSMFWDCTTGKYVDSDKSDINFGNIGFISNNKNIYLPNKLINTLKAAISRPDCIWPAHIGPIACSSSVIQNYEFIQKQVLKQVSNTIALDMESYGIVYSCNRFWSMGTQPIIIKGISDFADSKKSYSFQKYAAMKSCEFCKFLCDKILE